MRACILIKHCKMCNQSLEAKVYFNKDRHKSDGYRSYCKQCDRLRARLYYSNNREGRAVYKKVLNPRQWYSCLTYFDNACAYCGADINLTQDHIIPLSKNGSNEVNNILPACEYCNKTKYTSDMLSWYRCQSFYSSTREKRILAYLKEVF